MFSLAEARGTQPDAGGITHTHIHGSAHRWAGAPNKHPYHVKFVQRTAISGATPQIYPGMRVATDGLVIAFLPMPQPLPASGPGRPAGRPERSTGKKLRLVRVIHGKGDTATPPAVDLPWPACDSNDRLTLSAL
jgi:hypothetical protein